MRFPAPYRFSNRELFAIAVVLALLIAGVWLGVCLDPAWLSRFGALVIIVGVIFAVTDLPIALERRARAIAKVTNALVFRTWLNQLEEEQHKAYTHNERDSLWQRFEKLNEPDVDRDASIPKRRFLMVETTIICIGTFTNGFGEWLARLIGTLARGK